MIRAARLAPRAWRHGLCRLTYMALLLSSTCLLTSSEAVQDLWQAEAAGAAKAGGAAAACARR